MIRGLLIAIIVISVGSKNLWEYFNCPMMYHQGNTLAWLLGCGLIVYLIDETKVWARKIALILFWWAVSDTVELFFMDRTAFDANEYVTAFITVLIILLRGKRKRHNGSIRRTGY